MEEVPGVKRVLTWWDIDARFKSAIVVAVFIEVEDLSLEACEPVYRMQKDLDDLYEDAAIRRWWKIGPVGMIQEKVDGMELEKGFTLVKEKHWTDVAIDKELEELFQREGI